MTSRPTGDRAAATRGRVVAYVLALLCFVGVAVSVELTKIHVFVHTDPSYRSVCAMSERVNCETVAVSPYSVFAGIPVSLWGLVGYLFMGGLALWALRRRRMHRTWPLGLLLLLASGSVAVSAALAFVSLTRINSVCLFCMSAYAINVGLLGVAIVAARQSRVRCWDLLRDDVKALIARPPVLAGLGLTVVLTLGALAACVPSYWQSPGWLDLPKLPAGGAEHQPHWIGAREPQLTIVEFSDYECPHCRAAHRAMRMLAGKYPKKVRLVHRHLPLDKACHPGLRRPFHQRACLLAEAAECAGLQGRFWEMNDAIFSTQETVRAAELDPVKLATRLGLHREAFKRCLATHAMASRIAIDVKEGMAKKLRGTPSFVIGDQVFLGGMSKAQLERLLRTTIGRRP